MISDSSYQHLWCSDGSGQILLHYLSSQLEFKTKNISFHMELSADMYRQHCKISSHSCPHAVSPSVLQVPLINSVQESCGQSDTRNTYQTVPVSKEEHFVISPTT